MCRHLLARCHSFKSEFRQAIEMEKEVLKTYMTLFGEEHDKTKGTFQKFYIDHKLGLESNEFLKFLTQQAVSMAKTMSAMANKSNVKGHLPLPMQPPVSSFTDQGLKVSNSKFWFSSKMN